MDVIQRIVSVDYETRTVGFRLEPDPRRYEWVERDGERLLYDRYDRTYWPHAVVMKALKQVLRLEQPPPLPVLSDIERYVSDRRPIIAAGLRGESSLAGRTDSSQELLASLAGDELGFVILSVDIEGSSQLANRVDRPTLSRVLGTFLTEVAELVALFHGHVLRYAGDGLVAYFPEPGFITKNDLAIDCAVCIRRLFYAGFNEELVAVGLAPLELRLGLDAGEAAVLVLGSDRTKRHADIIGDVVSLASNIEAAAGSGDIYFGATVERNLHVTWREQCEPATMPPGWAYRGVDGDIYQLAKVPREVKRPIEQHT